RLLKRSVRQPDPYYAVEDGWVVRRLGSHCGRIGVAQFPQRHDERLILRDMGQETANMHLATPDQKAKVLSDLSARKRDWLLDAARNKGRLAKLSIFETGRGYLIPRLTER